MRNIIFCIPGSQFTGEFFDAWTGLVMFCLQHDINPILSRKYSNNIYYSRNLCLGGDVARGENQLPFDGKFDYERIVWLDSDNILRSPSQLLRLINHNVDIVSGIYMMDGGLEFATVMKWDEEYFAKNKRFKFLTPANLIGNLGLLPAAFTGMGFMACKKGVFESMTYPWFDAMHIRIDNMKDFAMEDVSFCLRAKEKGYTVWIDPQVRVGHQKSKIF